MTIHEFEKKIQNEIDKRLTIRRTQPDICGVYLDQACLYVSLPPMEIMPKRSSFYIDVNGHPYRGIEEAMQDIRAKVKGLDKEKYDLLTPQS